MVVNSTITGAYLVAVLGLYMYHHSRDPNLTKAIIHGNWLTSIQGARDLQCLSACALKASEQVSIPLQTWRAAGSVLWILAGMVVLSWHWYRSSAGDGSLVSIGVAQSARRVSCRSALLYLAHWSACFTDFTHASANPFDCG